MRILIGKTTFFTMTANISTPSEDELLRLLPFYIEHKLLLQKLGKENPWKMKRTDPTWQAVCRYYSLCVKSGPVDMNKKDVLAFRQWLASGDSFVSSGDCFVDITYPTIWDVNQIMILRNPRNTFINFVGDASGWSNRSKAPGAELPLTGFMTHMKTKPSGVLTLSKFSGTDGFSLLMLDDGLFKTAYDWEDNPAVIVRKPISVEPDPPPVKIFVNHPTLDADDVRREIWRRWVNGWECAQPPAIMTEDGNRFSGTDYITAIMSDRLKQFDQVKPMLNGVLKWKQGQESVVKVIVAFIQRRLNADPKGTTSQLKELPQEQRSLLGKTSPHLQAALL
jgi:hypothetical protein